MARGHGERLPVAGRRWEGLLDWPSWPQSPRKSLDAPEVARLANDHGTPFYLYDASVFRERVAALRDFDVVRYAQKACSNIHILKLLRAEGCVVDAVSLGEIERAVRGGFRHAGRSLGHRPSPPTSPTRPPSSAASSSTCP